MLDPIVLNLEKDADFLSKREQIMQCPLLEREVVYVVSYMEKNFIKVG